MLAIQGHIGPMHALFGKSLPSPQDAHGHTSLE